MAFVPSFVSERPLYCNVNRGQERSATHEEAAVARSKSVCRLSEPSPNICRMSALLGDPSI
jgi:hypothetical protein